MHINQISAAVDSKLQQLDKQLDALVQQQAQAQGQADAGQNPNLAQDIAALQQLRQRLVKSRDLALRAHQLERDTNREARERARLRQRRLGLALCGFSLAAGLALAVYAWFSL